jgi:putative phosphoribosyl transferase
LGPEAPYIFALPKGGVPVAEPIAHLLGRPLNILLIKKITAPGYPELAIGALAEDRKVIWNEDQIQIMKLSKAERNRLLVKAEQTLYRQRRLWKTESRVTDLKDQTVILVDDGLATGATLLTAIDFLKKRRPRKLIVAVPAGTPQAVQRIRSLVDEVICPLCSDELESVSQAYVQFGQVSERTVSEILDANP